MNLKEKILELNAQHTDESADIDNLLLTVMTRFQLFEPCRYLGEDDEWVNIAMLSIENEDLTQAMSVRKSEITMFGIFNPAEIEISQIKTEPEDFYQ